MGIDFLNRAVRSGALVGAVWLFTLGTVLAMPPIQHWQTANGARVYYVPAPELPMVDVRVVFAAGSVRDGDLPGLASMTNHLLDKGAAGLTANELAARLEGLGAELGSGALRDMAWVSLRSLSDAVLLEPALGVLQQVLGQPDFNAGDFERERERTLVSLREDEQSPATIAGYRFYRAVFGEHPYATRPVGDAASLQRMTLRDIRAYYEKYYVAGNAVIAIVGNVDRKAAEHLAQQLAGALRDGEAAPAVAAVAALEDASEERILHPSTQTHV
ncbi:MAG: insulinase family protein, partial [Gammaproteobacteria bacterium]|nr:insulinase family protein [Gammaproteobacteria bacterium]